MYIKNLFIYFSLPKVRAARVFRPALNLCQAAVTALLRIPGLAQEFADQVSPFLSLCVFSSSFFFSLSLSLGFACSVSFFFLLLPQQQDLLSHLHTSLDRPLPHALDKYEIQMRASALVSLELLCQLVPRQCEVFGEAGIRVLLSYLSDLPTVPSTQYQQMIVAAVSALW